MIAVNFRRSGRPFSLLSRLFLWLWVVGTMLLYVYQFRELVRPVLSLIGQ